MFLFVGLLIIPETPYYLMRKHRFNDARKSLKWLRGTIDDSVIEKEYQQIYSECTKNDTKLRITYKEMLTKRVYLHPFLIANILFFFRQFCGFMVVVFFGESIFKESLGDALDPGLSAFLIVFAKVIGTVMAISVVERLGRRILLIFSHVVMCIGMAVTAVWFLMNENQADPADEGFLISSNPLLKKVGIQNFDPELVTRLNWLPLTGLMFYIFAFAAGIGPISWTMNAEMISPEAKTLSSPLSHFLNWMFAYVVVVFKYDMKEALNWSGLFFLFSGICLCGIIFCILFVPETKGKNPAEIKKMFEGKMMIALLQKNH